MRFRCGCASAMGRRYGRHTGRASRRGLRSAAMKVKAVLFDIDGTLIDTGGAGARSWRWGFERLRGVAADIAESSSAGMTDPDVAIRTFEAGRGRAASGSEPRPLFAVEVVRPQRR